jgi:hypothetical protein
MGLESLLHPTTKAVRRIHMGRNRSGAGDLDMGILLGGADLQENMRKSGQKSAISIRL